MLPEEGGPSNLASELFPLHRNWKANQVPHHVSPQPLGGASSHHLALGWVDLGGSLPGMGAHSSRSGGPD